MEFQILSGDAIATGTGIDLQAIAQFQMQTELTDLAAPIERSPILPCLRYLFQAGFLPIKAAANSETNRATTWWIPSHQLANADYLTQAFTTIAPDDLNTFEQAGSFRLKEIIELFAPEWLPAIAQALTFSRPLTTYPGWYFNIVWDAPDSLSQFRQAVWEYCYQQHRPLMVQWQAAEGWKTWLQLGNDISSQLFVGGCYEPNEFWFLQQVLQPGMTVLDIGANEGLYSLAAAHAVGEQGRVIAVEPSQREFDRLQANIQLNHWQDVIHPYRLALADRTGEAQLTVAAEEHAGQNTLGHLIYQGSTVAQIETVSVRCLDDWLPEIGVTQVDVIKIDTEGAELAILRSSQHLLQTHHPLLLLELSDASLQTQGGSAIALVQLLRSLGYRIFAISHRTGQPVYVPDPCLEQATLSDNIVAAHPQRRWTGLPAWETLDQPTGTLPVLHQQLLQAQWETEQTQMALTRSQAQCKQVQTAMARLQVDYTNAKRWQWQAQQDRNAAQDRVTELGDALHQANIQLQQANQWVAGAEQWMDEVQASVFWKLRHRWMQMKKSLGLPSSPVQPYRKMG